jgi:hypothetical protein
MPREIKIALGVNLFGRSVRTDLCIESLLAVKKKYPNVVDLYNLQFEDKSKIGREHSDFKTLHVLKTSNQTFVPSSTRTIPIMQELFDVLANLNYDYFVFTNDDIIVSDRFIESMLQTDYDCYPASRLAIEPITSLTQTISGDHYQVAGFDTFGIRTSWWKKHREEFPAYILGHPCWDVHYATLCMKLSDSTLCNKWPPPTFHIKHGEGSQYSNDDVDYNNSLYWKPHVFDMDMWHHYLFNVLLLRGGGAGYWTPHKNEVELERKCFNSEWFKEHYWSYAEYQQALVNYYTGTNSEIPTSSNQLLSS